MPFHGKTIGFLLGISFFLIARVAPAELTLGLNTHTGSLIATDFWRAREYEEMRKDSGRAFDPKGGLSDAPGGGHYRSDFILAETVELARDGTNLTLTLVIAKYSASGVMHPGDLYRTFWIEARDRTGALGAAYYGYASGYPSHYKDHVPVSQLKLEVLHKERTKVGESLWILKVQGSVALTRPVTHLPDLKIDFSNLSKYMELTRLQKQATDLYQQWQPPTPVTPALAPTNLTSHPQPSVITPNRRTTASQPETPTPVLPGVTLSITKQDDLLLITFSPIVTGASLEQATLNANPWVWQPAVTATKTATNGWYVAPIPESRIFRIRLEQ